MCLFDISTCRISSSFFFFNDTATTEIYTLSLHDALPISHVSPDRASVRCTSAASAVVPHATRKVRAPIKDRKSTRLNSSHGYISYAVFCLKKKKKKNRHRVDSTVSVKRRRPKLPAALRDE